jgi:hypothetical protein
MARGILRDSVRVNPGFSCFLSLAWFHGSKSQNLLVEYWKLFLVYISCCSVQSAAIWICSLVQFERLNQHGMVHRLDRFYLTSDLLSRARQLDRQNLDRAMSSERFDRRKSPRGFPEGTRPCLVRTVPIFGRSVSSCAARRPSNRLVIVSITVNGQKRMFGPHTQSLKWRLSFTNRSILPVVNSSDPKNRFGIKSCSVDCKIGDLIHPYFAERSHRNDGSN